MPFSCHNSLLVKLITVESIGNNALAFSTPSLIDNLLFSLAMIFSNTSISRILLTLENNVKPIQHDTKKMYLVRDNHFWAMA